LLEDWGLGDSPDGLDAFVDIVVEAAIGSVAIVKPQSAFYERHGWRGIRTLTRLVEDCRSGGVLVLLDAKRGDVGSTNEAYGEAYFRDDGGLRVDALTVTPYLGLVALRSVIDRAAAGGGAVFVVTRSSNPEGRVVQGARLASGRSVEQHLMVQIGEENTRLSGGDVGPVGAVFAPMHEAPTDFDLPSMNGLFLAPGLGAQGATVDDVVACFSTCADRVLPAASRSLLVSGPDIGALREAVVDLGSIVKQALAVT
jgi:orotidine-5'-phosphate decarboxylase